MERIDKIPITKVQRAAKIAQTGAKVGVNYLKYYGKKIVKDSDEAKKELDESNAEDIYNGLKQLKGSALKMAQMMSMDNSMLPEAYVEKFSLAQFSVPSLSAPLVNKTFKQYFGKRPQEVFDRFSPDAVNAASIGQVHQAEKDGKKLAVKIQYPGVADSISSDLALVKPIAKKMFNIRGKDSDVYFKEVEGKLLEETDYLLELKSSEEMAKACAVVPNLVFANYYPELSSERIITMDWMEGQHLSEFCKTNKDKELATQIAQTLWDFYMFQFHKLRKVHADPHPGNFLINSEGQLIAIDFGCMKVLPDEFYNPYFELIRESTLNDPKLYQEKLFELGILKTEDTPTEIEFFSDMFRELLTLFARPFHNETFNFSDADFFQEISDLADKYSKDPAIKKMNGNRGSKHFIYANRTFFGLFSMMHNLNGNGTDIHHYTRYLTAE